MRKILFSLLLSSVIVPHIVFAAWWNPLSWFNGWEFFARKNTTEVAEQNQRPQNQDTQHTQDLSDADAVTTDLNTYDMTTPVCTTEGARNYQSPSTLDTQQGEYADASVCEWSSEITTIPGESGHMELYHVIKEEGYEDIEFWRWVEIPRPPVEPIEPPKSELPYCTCKGSGTPSPVGKPYRTQVYMTVFGGSGDSVLKKNTQNQIGSVSKKSLMTLDSTTDKYISWPMPNTQALLGLPNVEQCFGPKTESWKGERIARANEALNDHELEISYTDANGNKNTVRGVQIVTRGPAEKDIIDASQRVWNELGLGEASKKTKSEQTPVTLEITLVSKQSPKDCRYEQ